MSEKKFFAAFVMTYNRSAILPDTVQKLKQQTFPPEYILIVDNSDNDLTEQLIQSFNDSSIGYYKVGYNSGPAGAAYYGLKTLAEAGYEWIYWGDDDDPPRTNNTFESLLQHVPKMQHNVGQIGFVGHRFNIHTGKVVKTTNDEIKDSGLLEVDTISGGMCKIVRSDVVKNGVLPDKTLFFGFEELDFDLRLKQAGYISVVDKELFYSERKKAGKLQPNSSASTNQLKASWREYYSIRNLLFILSLHKQYRALTALVIRKLLKIPMAYRYGMRNGNFTAKLVALSINDWLFNNRITRKF